ncbi:hypothetical protein S83_024756 [Arachis hypogaea]|nr:uncharacterized protein DS421_8g228590 [Arachis hypogaea]
MKQDFIFVSNIQTFPSDDELGRLSAFIAVDVVVNTELVPLEGEDEGEGSFFGSIWSQYSFGNLDPCDDDRTQNASRVNTNNLCLQQEPPLPKIVMMIIDEYYY